MRKYYLLTNINFSVILFFVQRWKLRRMMEQRFHLYTLGMALFLTQKGCVEKICMCKPIRQVARQIAEVYRDIFGKTDELQG